MTQSNITSTPLINPVPPAGSEEKVEALYQPIKHRLGMLPSGIEFSASARFCWRDMSAV